MNAALYVYFCICIFAPPTHSSLGAEGLIHWAQMKNDFHGRGKIAQAFRRVKQDHPHVAVIWDDLVDHQERECLAHWNMARDLEFLKEIRKITHVTIQGESDEGEMMTRELIGESLGAEIGRQNRT